MASGFGCIRLVGCSVSRYTSASTDHAARRALCTTPPPLYTPATLEYFISLLARIILRLTAPPRRSTAGAPSAVNYTLNSLYTRLLLVIWDRPLLTLRNLSRTRARFSTPTTICCVNSFVTPLLLSRLVPQVHAPAHAPGLHRHRRGGSGIAGGRQLLVRLRLE